MLDTLRPGSGASHQAYRDWLRTVSDSSPTLIADEIEKLASLSDRYLTTEQEFARQKAN
jgi:hypothetical protein